MKVSIIIPVLNEEKGIKELLNHLQKFKRDSEVILVNGKSKDKTVEIASCFDYVKIISSRRGRAQQMNAGAKVASGDILLFLHADTYLPKNAIETIEETVKNGTDYGCFSLKIESSRLPLIIASKLINLRTKITHVSSGDQTIFVRRELFEKINGYADIPLMEDLELTRRLKNTGNFVELDLEVSTSPRRWEKWGIYKTVLLMWTLRSLYYIGIPPEKLVKFYQNVR